MKRLVLASLVLCSAARLAAAPAEGDRTTLIVVIGIAGEDTYGSDLR